MRKLFLFLFLPLIFSCGTGESETTESGNFLENFTFSVDTVVVNPGEEIINLAWGLRLSDLSVDKKTLYLLDEKDQMVSIVDLDELKLKRKLPFEKEGPNGIGEYIATVQVLPNDRFLFSGFRNRGIYTAQGKKLDELSILASNIEGLNPDYENSLWYGVRLSSDEKYLFSLPGDFFEGSRDLVVIDFSTKKGKVIDIPAMDLASDFRIVLQSEEMMSVYVEEVSIQDLNGKLIIRTTAASNAYLYDYLSDSLHLMTFDHKLVANKREGTIRNEVSSQKEFEDEMAKLSIQIGFENFVWDDKSKKYFRFGRIYKPKVDDDTPRVADVFLFAYDENLKLIGETKVEGLTSVPSTPFFKDGKLWSYVNVEDELGFAVMDFNF